MGGGGEGQPDCFPKSICLLFMFIHIIQPFGWRHVYVRSVGAWAAGASRAQVRVLFAEETFTKKRDVWAATLCAFDSGDTYYSSDLEHSATYCCRPVQRSILPTVYVWATYLVYMTALLLLS